MRTRRYGLARDGPPAQNASDEHAPIAAPNALLLALRVKLPHRAPCDARVGAGGRLPPTPRAASPHTSRLRRADGPVVRDLAAHRRTQRRLDRVSRQTAPPGDLPDGQPLPRPYPAIRCDQGTGAVSVGVDECIANRADGPAPASIAAISQGVTVTQTLNAGLSGHGLDSASPSRQAGWAALAEQPGQSRATSETPPSRRIAVARNGIGSSS